MNIPEDRMDVLYDPREPEEDVDIDPEPETP